MFTIPSTCHHMRCHEALSYCTFLRSVLTSNSSIFGWLMPAAALESSLSTVSLPAPHLPSYIFFVAVPSHKMKKEYLFLQVPGFALLRRNCASASFVREMFWRENFCTAWAPRSVSRANRGSKNHGMFLDSRCFVGTLVLQVLLAKFFGTEIFEKHGRHAAFQEQTGGAKIMVSSWIRGACGA